MHHLIQRCATTATAIDHSSPYSFHASSCSPSCAATSAASPAPVSLAPTSAATPDPSPELKSSHPPFKIPMARTFYRSLAPGAQPFVKVGDKVQKGQMICIVEGMKLIN